MHKTPGILFLLAVLIGLEGIGQSANPKTISFYVGTYTQGDSEGIYQYRLLANGQFEKIGLVAKTENPSYLAKTANGKFLLAVNEVQDQANGGGRVTSFAITSSGLLQKDSKLSGGASPCYISVNRSGDVLTANYSSGTTALLKITNSGMLQGPLDVRQHEGKGIHPRQDKPHAHGIWFQGKDDIISIDLGTNELWFSKLDRTQQKMIAASPAKLAMVPGAGPRHLTVHPNGPWLYVINELNSTITQVKRVASNQYEIMQSWSTLPVDFKGENLCADIHVSADGRFLYASNRGHNSLAIFSINAKEGSLQLIGHESVRGDWPRNFALSPDDSFLLVANQRSNNLISFQRNKATGKLTFVQEIAAPTPVCILF